MSTSERDSSGPGRSIQTGSFACTVVAPDTLQLRCFASNARQQGGPRSLRSFSAPKPFGSIEITCRHISWRRPRPLAMQSKVAQTPRRRHGSPAFGGGSRASSSTNRRREARSRDQWRDRVSVERSDRPAGELVGGPGVACEFSARPRRVERSSRGRARSPEGARVTPAAR
jgi:hypothetical protein